LLFDTVPEGVLVTVHDGDRFVCAVSAREARIAVAEALAAAENAGDDEDVLVELDGAA
jgi:hypothetical protein